MVSSKCCQVESPSPFRFFAALIPPCAHTECERFTGTMENRSTCPPISAILMTAARPARPPPMTMIFGFDAILLYRLSMPQLFVNSGLCFLDCLCSGRIGGLLGETRTEGVQTRQADYARSEEERQTHIQKPAARPIP